MFGKITVEIRGVLLVEDMFDPSRTFEGLQI